MCGKKNDKRVFFKRENKRSERETPFGGNMLLLAVAMPSPWKV
jgi:hypothetical protein